MPLTLVSICSSIISIIYETTGQFHDEVPAIEEKSLSPDVNRRRLLILYLPASSADNFCKQFGPRSGPVKCQV